MTDWLSTAELAEALGITEYSVIEALEDLSLAQGAHPTGLALDHALGEFGGEAGPLWHEDTKKLLAGWAALCADRGRSAERPEETTAENPEIAQQELFDLEGVEGAERQIDPGVAEAYGFEDEDSDDGAVTAATRARANSGRTVPDDDAAAPVPDLPATAGPRGTSPVGNPPAGYDAVLATDGSCSGNPGPGGWAWVEQLTGDRRSGGARRTTNNVMELTALIEGLEHVGPEPDLLLRIDSQYVINVMTKWAAGWKRKGWKKKDGKPVANRELVERLLDLYQARTGRTDVEWVKGHAGDAANELVDSLAVEQTKKHSR